MIPVCLLPERIYNVEEALVPAMIERLPAARRVKYVRCLRQRRDEEYWRRLWQQTVAPGACSWTGWASGQNSAVGSAKPRSRRLVVLAMGRC